MTVHTAYDVMREYMITGAELDGRYQIPMMDRYVDEIPQDTVDFKDSFSRKIKNHRDLCINFYIHDCEFEKLWKQKLLGLNSVRDSRRWSAELIRLRSS